MNILLDQLSQLPPELLVEALPGMLAAHIADADARALALTQTQPIIDSWTAEQSLSIRDHLASVGSEIAIYRAHPLLRPISRFWCGALFSSVSITGLNHLDAALADGPVVIIGNHLSYVDTQATDTALWREGRTDIADQLITVAGPKVYDSLFRRFASSCLSTLPVPQSGAVSDASVSRRELAKRAIRSLQLAKELPEQGGILQIYPEGTRARDGRFGSFLKGVHRYVAVPGCTIIPMAHAGTDIMYPVDAAALGRADYSICYGKPIVVAEQDSTRHALETAWHAVAAMLPERLKPNEDTPALT